MNISQESYSELSKIYDYTNRQLSAEKNIGSIYRWPDRLEPDYTLSFSEVLRSSSSLQSRVDEIKKDKGSCFVLDVASYGHFLNSLENIDGGISIALVDNRNPKAVERQDKKNLKVVVGEMLAHSPWVKVDRYLENDIKSQRKFDIITCMPLNGWQYPDAGVRKSYPFDLQYVVIKRMWERLAEGGSLFVQLPWENIDNPVYKTWLHSLKENDVNFDTGTGQISKGSNFVVHVLRIDKSANNTDLPKPRPID